MEQHEKPGGDSTPQPGFNGNLHDQNNDWITEEQVDFSNDPEAEFFHAIEEKGLLPPTTLIDDGKPQLFDGIETGQYDCKYWFDGTKGGFKTPDERTWCWETGSPAKRDPKTNSPPLAIRCLAEIESKPIDFVVFEHVAAMSLAPYIRQRAPESIMVLE